jgi:alpha-tubulin suppressor-like RCC1 family protein
MSSSPSSPSSPIPDTYEECVALAKTLTHEGWLVKKAVRTISKQSWKKRYFRIRNCEISYHADDKPTTPAKHTLLITPETKVRICSLRQHLTATRELEVSFPAVRQSLYAIPVEEEGLDEKTIVAFEKVISKIINLLLPADVAAAKRTSDAKAKAASVIAANEVALDEEKRLEKLTKLRLAEKEYTESKRNSLTLSSSPSSPKKTAASVAAGSVSTLLSSPTVQHKNRALYSWGLSDQGQLGLSEKHDQGIRQPRRIDMLRGAKLAVESISCGVQHAAACTIEGRLMIWGGGADGQLGNGPAMLSSWRPYQLGGVMKEKRVFSVACGETHTLAVVSGGQIYSWGSGDGVLGLGATLLRVFEPTLVTGGDSTIEAVDRVFAGRSTSAAITASGKCLIWGSNGGTGRLALGPDYLSSTIYEPVSVPVLNALPDNLRVTHVALGEIFSAFLVGEGIDSSDGNSALLVSGVLGTSQEEFESRKSALSWAHVTGVLGHRRVISSISAGRTHLAFVADGSVYTLGRGWLGGGSRGGDVSDEPIALSELDAENIVDVACGDSHTLALSDDGRIYAWGSGEFGNLGRGLIEDPSRKPILVGDLEYGTFHATKIACGADYSLALAFPGAPARRKSPEELALAEKTKSLEAAALKRESDDLGSDKEGKLRRSKSLLIRRQSWRSKVAVEGPGTPSSPSADIDVAFRRIIEDAVPLSARPPGSRHAAVAVSQSLPSGWTSNVDAASGARYYINTITGLSQWEVPTSAQELPISATWSGLGGR